MAWAPPYTHNASRQRLQVVLRTATAFGVQVPAKSHPAGVAPLPVVLPAFEGQRAAAAGQFSWYTVSAQHSLGFEMQRQTGATTDFATIGWVASAGNSAQSSGYTFRDAAAPATSMYYRLRHLT